MKPREVRAALDRLKAAAAQGLISVDDVTTVERGIGDMIRWVRSYGESYKRHARQVYALANKKSRITAAERKQASEINSRLMKAHPVKTPRYAAIARKMDISIDRVRSILEGRRPAQKK